MIDKLAKVLKLLYVIQEVSNKDRNSKLGRGFSVARRFNPYNPISYVFLLITLVIGILMFGLIGFWNQIDPKNPFQWD